MSGDAWLPAHWCGGSGVAFIVMARGKALWEGAFVTAILGLDKLRIVHARQTARASTTVQLGRSLG